MSYLIAPTSNDIVTPHMIQRFEVLENCIESYPCCHQCKITLSDLREKSTLLNGNIIYSLINEIANDKIIGNRDHFNEYENVKIKFPGTPYSTPNLEAILTRSFQA